MTIDLLDRANTGFRHEALFYDDPKRLLSSLTDFITDAVRAGEPTLVLLPSGGAAPARDQLPVSDLVEYGDAREVARNPARMISAWHDFIVRRGRGGTALRCVSELVWPGRTPEELEECYIHEHLLGLAFDGSNPWTLLCPYDADNLDPALVERARLTHPACPRRRHSHRGGDVSDVMSGPLLDAPADAVTFQFTADRLKELRHRVAAETARMGLVEKGEDFVFAVNEVATNSLTHGGGRGRARLWTTERSVVCDVLDEGHIRDPLAGRRRPPVPRTGGHGLWLANQMCDLLQVRTRSGGTVVRLHMYVD